MKSEIVGNQDVQKGRTYPWLGHSYIGNKEWEKVVLFVEHDTGVVVSAIGNKVVLGELSDNWNEECFTEFKGRVILSND